MNLANKVFRNNKTGESIRVIDSFENIAILENKQKIDVRTLMDSNQFTEQIDPASFFNNQNAYDSLVDKIKSLPTENMKDDALILPDQSSTIKPASDESAIIYSSEEDERAELMRKYGMDTNSNNDIQKQNDAFSKLLEETDLGNTSENQPIQRVEVDREPELSHELPEPYQQQIQPTTVEDPIITMFKKTKRNVNFKINFDISDKIPRLDFIEMMEDSYEISMIDFLADEFTNKILQDPSLIRNTIKEKIKQLVYGIESFPTPVNPQITDAVTQLKEDVSFNEKTGEVKTEKTKTTTTRKPRTKKQTTEK